MRNYPPLETSLTFACDISPPFVAFHRYPIYRVTFPFRQLYRRASLTISKSTSAKPNTFSAAPIPNPSIKIVRLESRPLNVPLLAPFKIASTTQYSVQNVAIRVQLADGSVGWGESPTLPPVTAEDQPGALAGMALAATWLMRQAPASWQDLVRGLAKELPGHTYASVSDTISVPVHCKWHLSVYGSGECRGLSSSHLQFREPQITLRILKPGMNLESRLELELEFESKPETQPKRPHITP